MNDVTHSESRELNQLPFDRFDARLDRALADAAWRIERQLTHLEITLKEQIISQTRWMIGMWATVLVAVLGLWIRR